LTHFLRRTALAQKTQVRSLWELPLPLQQAQITISDRMNRQTNQKLARKSNDFESVARGLWCDEDKEQFEKKLGKIAKAKTALEPKG
jgi:hypothetical protein